MLVIWYLHPLIIYNQSLHPTESFCPNMAERIVKLYASNDMAGIGQANPEMPAHCDRGRSRTAQFNDKTRINLKKKSNYKLLFLLCNFWLDWNIRRPNFNIRSFINFDRGACYAVYQSNTLSQRKTNLRYIVKCYCMYVYYLTHDSNWYYQYLGCVT